ATSSPKPVVSVVVGEPEATIPLPGGERSLPVFTFPEPAVTALGAAYRHARVVAQGRPGPPVRPDAIDSRAALDAVRRARTAGREWLDPDECHRVLTAYGLPVLAQRTAVSHAEAAAAADELGYPVALKLGRPGIHKSEVGGVRLGLRDEADLAAAIAELGPDGTPLLLQPMAVAGVELIVGAIRDPQCGPLVMVGAGGVRTGLMRDRAFALAPISSDEAQALVQRLRIAGQLTDTAALADIVVRVGTLVVDHPEIAELDLNPVVHRPDGNQVVDARIRITGAAPTPDPLVRQLRAGPATGSG
ncbi:MAG: acetate--CoA ligase family protein, partial [Actinobacteria bacterium]|nr:acetate--CoA ligase family protein [Actinomycetota bacterium]